MTVICVFARAVSVMQMIGALNCDLHHCFVHPRGGSLRRNVTISAEQKTFLLPWNSPFAVFVAFRVKLLFETKSCHLHR